MTMKERSLLMKECTDSVLSYIRSIDGQETVNKYFSVLKSQGDLESAKPNYSDMLKILEMNSGTTKDDVSFGSIYVNRGSITKVLREQYESVLAG